MDKERTTLTDLLEEQKRLRQQLARLQNAWAECEKARQALEEKESVLQHQYAELEAQVEAHTNELTLTNVRLQAEIAERQRIAEALQQQNANLSQLNLAGQKLTATLDLSQVLEDILQAVTQIIHTEGSTVWLWDNEEHTTLVCKTASDPGPENELLNTRLDSEQGIVGWVAGHNQSTIVQNVAQDPRFTPDVDVQTGFATQSILATPLRTREGVIGVLEAVNKAEDPFTPKDLALVETLASFAAIAIENARLVADLQKRNNELNTFARAIAHDIKNPLTYIMGYAETLEQTPNLPAETLSPYLRTIAQSARKVKSIIDELMILAGLREQQVVLQPLDMGRIVDEAKQRLIDITSPPVEIVEPERWPTAQGHAPWVEEIWVNYISNAIKYGGDPPRVELGAEEEPESIRFWVRDNGEGIAKDKLTSLFKPFERLDKVKVTGHGLGLSIVHWVAEKQQGDVKVESELGQGSIFSFSLPKAQGGGNGSIAEPA